MSTAALKRFHLRRSLRESNLSLRKSGRSTLTAPRASHFEKGSTQPIYKRPISQEELEGNAVLVGLVRSDAKVEGGEMDYGPDIFVEEWMVRFGKETETFKRIVTEIIKPRDGRG